MRSCTYGTDIDSDPLATLKGAKPGMASEIENESTFNPQRRLCPDGSCIGVLGSDGKCTVCGTYDSDAACSPPPDPLAGATSNETSDEPEASETSEPATGFNPNRRLCSDDSCIGVIGEDGRCRECGKAASP
jgi:hypothetical protein